MPCIVPCPLSCIVHGPFTNLCKLEVWPCLSHRCTQAAQPGAGMEFITPASGNTTYSVNQHVVVSTGIVTVSRASPVSTVVGNYPLSADVLSKSGPGIADATPNRRPWPDSAAPRQDYHVSQSRPLIVCLHRAITPARPHVATTCSGNLIDTFSG